MSEPRRTIVQFIAANPEVDVAAYKVSESSTNASDLDSILKQQLVGLGRLTKQLVSDITAGIITKDTPNQLATTIKITMELKAKQKELLDDMPNEELSKLADEDK